MKLEDLRQPWRDANAEAATPVARDELIAKTCRRVERLWGTVFRRDLVETLVAMVVMYFFLKQAWDINAPALARTGAGVIVAGCALIVYRLHAARLATRRPPLDAPVQEFCRTEVKRINKQIELLRTVIWWYIAPLIVAVNLVFFGHAGFSAPSIVYCVTTLLLAWAVHALNQRAARKQLEPLRDDVAGLLRELEAAEDSSD